MPRPSLRSRSKKRSRLRLPGGRAETHYRREKASFSRCSKCGRKLSGIPRLNPSKIRGLPANQRRPERMYSGQLCPVCLRELLKAAARGA